jgi:MFS family permease
MLVSWLRPPSVPREYRTTFLHLLFDIGWVGVLSGSSINFLNVYAARLGASGFQIGLLAAVPALVSLAFAIPAGRWLERRPVDKAVFWTAVAARLGYLLWVPLPWLFGDQGQVWALVVIALLMGIPMTAVGVGFNALFAAAVPPEWRAYVAGIRNIVLSVTFMLTSLGSGYLLDHLPFPAGYQVVFGIGFLGAVLSTMHLYFVRMRAASGSSADPAAPGPAPAVEGPSPRRSWREVIRADIWKTPFGAILLVMLAFHLAQYLALPLFPLYFVNELGLTDANIGAGTALFYLTVLFGSTQLDRLTRRLGHHKITAWGVVGMSIYPVVLVLTRTVLEYYILSAFGGFMWALVGGAYANYLLDSIPENDRPAYLAWYNVVLNAGILTASLAGPALAHLTGLRIALVIVGVLRLAAGLAIFKWGKPSLENR